MCHFVLQNVIINVFFILGLIAGGAASAANAANIENDIDESNCRRLDDYPDYVAYSSRARAAQGACDDGEQLRDCQAASAVSFIHIITELWWAQPMFHPLLFIMILVS